MKFTKQEQKLIDYAKKRITQIGKLRKGKGLYDKMIAFVLSNSGKIYDGICFESETAQQSNICAETHAISNMIAAETEKASVVSILVATPVPENKASYCCKPCGRCRQIIHEFGKPNTSILCSQYIRKQKTWDSLKHIEKHTIKQLYPHAYEPFEWDE